MLQQMLGKAITDQAMTSEQLYVRTPCSPNMYDHAIL